MDIGLLREIVTVVSFVTFICIAAWAYSARSQRSFSEAALLPFVEDGDGAQQ